MLLLKKKKKCSSNSQKRVGAVPSLLRNYSSEAGLRVNIVAGSHKGMYECLQYTARQGVLLKAEVQICFWIWELNVNKGKIRPFLHSAWRQDRKICAQQKHAELQHMRNMGRSQWQRCEVYLTAWTCWINHFSPLVHKTIQQLLQMQHCKRARTFTFLGQAVHSLLQFSASATASNES